MCGIAMVVNSGFGHRYHSPKLNDTFADLMLASAVRGTDATGMFQLDSTNRLWWDKYAMASGVALQVPSVKQFVSDVDSCSVTVGHVRHATVGDSADDQNSHPFLSSREDNSYVIGVHNGTLYGWESMDMYNQHTTDSSWAISHIAQEGAEAFKDFFGAFAIVWHDSRHPGKLFIARNNERPFHIARTKNKRTIIGCSEGRMLDWIAERNGIELEDGNIYSIDSGYIWSIDTTQEELSITMEEEIEINSWTSRSRPRTQATAVVPHTNLTPASCEVDITPWKEDTGKNRVVEAVKLALKKARMTVLSAEEEEDADTPIDGGDSDEILVRAQDGWFSTAGVELNDKKRAEYDGSFGSVVTFDPVSYDSFRDSVIGEIVKPEFYKRPLTYVENVSPLEWEQLRDTQRHMVVVGVRYFDKEKEYIVTPLNDEGVRALFA